MVRTCTLLGEAMGLPPDDIELIGYGALLHDVGKNSLPDSVLLKPGRLEPHERKLMSYHTVHGHDILREMRHPAFDMAAEVALCHHENYDGGGYPHGLAGEAIPQPARVVAVADVYDALRSDRPYKKGMSHGEAVSILLKGDDRTTPANFDPVVLQALSRQQAAVEATYTELLAA